MATPTTDVTSKDVAGVDLQSSWVRVLSSYTINGCRHCLLVAVLFILLFATNAIWLSAASAAGQIEMGSVSVVNESGRLILKADFSLELNATIEAGLISGVPIYFNADVRIKQSKLLWFDTTVYKARRRFALVYYELTRHYRVTIVNEDLARNFRSLFDALDYIGTLRDMRLISASALVPKKQYVGLIVFSLDIAALPLPLRPQAFVSSAWRLQSEEHRWPIN